MKYKFSISNSRFCHSEVYDDSTIDGEWLSNYDEDELFHKVCKLEELGKRNNHVLFDIVESLFQNNNCPPWIQAMGYQGNLICEFEHL